MRIISNAVEDVMKQEREKKCYYCDSRFAYLVGEVKLTRRTKFFLFVPYGHEWDDPHVICPVCHVKNYAVHLSGPAWQYLVDQHKKDHEASSYDGCDM